MATTPEGLVKKQVDKILDAAPFCGYDKPVVTGFGSKFLDYIGCSKGRHFEIETKRPGVNTMTPRQEDRAEKSRAVGSTVFFINGQPEQYAALEAWLHAD